MKITMLDRYVAKVYLLFNYLMRVISVWSSVFGSWWWYFEFLLKMHLSMIPPGRLVQGSPQRTKSATWRFNLSVCWQHVLCWNLNNILCSGIRLMCALFKYVPMQIDWTDWLHIVWHWLMFQFGQLIAWILYSMKIVWFGSKL